MDIHDGDPMAIHSANDIRRTDDTGVGEDIRGVEAGGGTTMQHDDDCDGDDIPVDPDAADLPFVERHGGWELYGESTGASFGGPAGVHLGVFDGGGVGRVQRHGGAGLSGRPSLRQPVHQWLPHLPPSAAPRCLQSRRPTRHRRPHLLPRRPSNPPS